jgi:hypothetical protein
MNRLKSILRHWLPLAVVIVAMSGLVYLAVQQDLRLGGNEPQVQMAEDAAAALARGDAALTVVPPGKVDFASSLAPFMVVYDDAGNIQAYSGTLGGQTPSLPSGVLDYTRANGEDRITWQPAPGVRIAAVVTRFEGPKPGFVLAGRSLREVEKRINLLGLQVGAALIAALAASLVVVVFVELTLHR